MKNPPTRPYTPEELEQLFLEDSSAGVGLLAGAEVVKPSQEVILQNNQTSSPEGMVLPPAAMPQKSPNQLARHLPYVVIGLIVVGVGVYLYYEHRKKRENEAEKNRWH